MTKTILAITACVITLCLAWAAGARAFTPPAGMEPKAAPVDLVVVIKSERVMHLLDKHNNIIKSYKVSLGKNPVGDKEREGDGRTPEGRYMIDGRNPNSRFHLSLRISYPNKSDKWRAKKANVNPGGDIFIHGLPNGKGWQWWKYSKKLDWTDGCIAVTDKEIREIWELVANDTPILIRP